jgi:hypothetical protein
MRYLGFVILLVTLGCTYPPLTDDERKTITDNFKVRLTELLAGKEGFETVHALEILESKEEPVGQIQVRYKLVYSTKDESSGQVKNSLESEAMLERSGNFFEKILGPIFKFGGKTWSAATITPREQELDFIDPLQIVIEK